MTGVDKLKGRLGANINESIDRDRLAHPAVPAARAVPATNRFQGINRIKGALELPLDRVIADPDQPRKEFDPAALGQLADSLKARGQLQPIRVRWDAALEVWVIIAGERRWRAAQLAGLTHVAAVECAGPLSSEDVLEEQLVENCLREDLKPVEQAKAFRALMDRRGWSAIRLAQALSLNDSTIIRALAILNLPCTVQDRIEDGSLAPSVAYEVSKVADPAEQAALAERVVSEGLTRAETVEAVKASRPADRAKGRGSKPKARKVTERVFRTAGGYKITVEYRRGIDAADLVSALRDALTQAEGGNRAAGQEAA